MVQKLSRQFQPVNYVDDFLVFVELQVIVQDSLSCAMLKSKRLAANDYGNAVFLTLSARNQVLCTYTAG